MAEEGRKRPDVEREYANDAIVVTWEPKFCTHTARCLMALPRVFDSTARPWVEIDAADPDEIAEVVQQCPTGALGFRRLDSGPQEALPSITQVDPRRNGPLFVRGALRRQQADGTVRDTVRAALCRCGGSANKPFCDGTHRVNGFQAD